MGMELPEDQSSLVSSVSWENIDVTIDSFSPVDADKAILRAWHDVVVAALAVDLPQDPLPVQQDTTAELTTENVNTQRYFWLARDTGNVVGVAELRLPLVQNRQRVKVDIIVAPEHRAHGYGTRLLAAAVKTARDHDRTVLDGAAVAGGAGSYVAERWGFSLAQVEARSLITRSTMDTFLVEKELQAGREGYRLVSWVGSAPDNVVRAYAAAKNAMADAPLGDLEFEPWHWNTEAVRAFEHQHAVGKELRVVVAVHEATGAIAGLTEVLISHWTPSRAWQEDTSVVREHRGHGLGIWLKSAMLNWLAEERSDVHEIQTWNAAENRYMRAINERLGFRVDAWENNYQAPL